MRRSLAFALLLFGCATSLQEDNISSLDALRLHEEGKLVVIDVRPPAEILRNFPKRPLIHLQYGPNEWERADAEVDVRVFLENVRNLPGGMPMALLCQSGVRSAAAAEALKRHGISARNVTDGYLGNNRGPGWRAWE